VYPVPTAMFDVDPQTRFTTIALPKFNFVNKSTVSSGSFTSAWDFGVADSDKDTATTKNAGWTYSNSPKDTGTYIVTLIITTDGGCQSIHIDSVRIGPDLTVFIPNAFTPNRFGPGVNNKFYVSAQGFASFEINIFNRWGEKLYHSTDINEGWDGNYKGQESQQDVYVYQVNVTSFSGKVYKYNGTITLLR
jgi:gliding motility-associated-like protein